MKTALTLFLPLCFVIAASSVSSAQSAFRQSEPQVLSPSAYEFCKYGEVPVDYFNGLPSITVPLTEIRAKGYTLPIYLTYHASGNKPDQHPGWVGQGWSLHAGGSITRVINGEKDEMSRWEYGHQHDVQPSSDPGYLYRAHLVQEETNWSDAETLYLNTLGGWGAIYDNEPDVYYLNLEGFQASFYISGDGNVKIVSKNGVSFDVDWELATDTQYNALSVYEHPTDSTKNYRARRYTYFRGFTVRDREGNTYCFGGHDDAIEYSVSQKANIYYVNGVCYTSSFWDATAVANAWMLTRIIRPDGEEIIFDYKHEDSIPIVLHDFHYGETYVAYVANNYLTGDFDTYAKRATEKNNLSFSFLLPTYLESISCRVSGDRLEFRSSPSTELGYTYTEADFERRIGNYSGSNFSMPFSSFKAKDYYLQLDSISGTGRNIALSYTSDNQTRLKLRNVCILDGDGGIVDHQYRFKYNTTPLPAYNSRKTDRWGYYNGQDYSSILGNLGPGMYAFRSPNATYMQAEMLTDIYYPTGGRTSFEYEPHTYYRVATQFPFELESCPADSLDGGLRIKTIENRDSTGVRMRRMFSYQDTYAGNLHSSGILSGRPRFHTSGNSATVVYFNNNHTASNYNLSFIYFNESPFNRLSDTNGDHITYSVVTETFADGGSVMYRYSNHDTAGAADGPPEVRLVSTNTDLNLSSKFNSRALFRGLLLEKVITSASGDPVLSESCSYDMTTADFMKSVSKFLFISSQVGTASYSKIFCGYPALTSKVVTSHQDTGTAITETFNYQYNSDRRPTVQTHTVKGITDGTVTYYPADRNGSVYAEMRQAGMSGIPVGQVQTRQGSVISGQELTFRPVPVETASGTGTAYLPDKLYSTNLTAPVSLSAYSANPTAYLSTTPEVEYRTYDNHGNLTGSVTADGIGTAYRWSADGLQPTLLARGVRIPVSTLADQTVQANHAISFNNDGLNATYHFTTVGASRTISASIYGSTNYDWLFEVQVDGQSGRIVSSQIPGAPPQSWIQYLTAYSGNIQFVVPAGEHTLTLREIDYRSAGGSSNPPLGNIHLMYYDAGYTTTGTEDTVLALDFEDGTGTAPGFRSGHSHSGTYTLNYTVPSDRDYDLDYMLWESGSWAYHRESYSGGSVTLGGSGKRLDNIRIFPADCDIITASYDDAVLMTSRTDARGITESYEYDGLQRLTGLRDNAGNDGNLIERYSYHYADASSIHNNVTTMTYTQADNATCRTSVAYLDSLGRPVQNVLVNGAASGWDLITYQDYDACGREFRKWLPAPVQVGSQHAAGAYASLAQIKTGGNQVYASGDAYRYEQPVYEASPRERVKEYYGPGSAWRSGSGHKTRETMASNTMTASNVRYYRGYSIAWTGNTSLTLSRAAAASAESLQITQTEDEDGRKTLEFKDSFGQTVLIRQVYSSSVFYDTHYVYDGLGRLAAVLPPKLSERLSSGSSWSYGDISDLAYLYRYDSRGNCIASSLPGAGWTYTVYDRGNRPVLTQDAAQRAQSANAWSFSIPDHLGRQTLRGTATLSVDAFSDPYINTVVLAALPVSPVYTDTYRGYALSGIALSSPTLLEVDYYDNYAFAGANPFPAANNTDFSYDSSIGTSFSARYAPSAQGLQTGSLVRVLDGSAGDQYLWSVSYYDDRAQVVQHRASTHLGGVEKDCFLYDFTGNVTKHQVQYKPASGTALTETVTQTYSLWGLPVKTTHKLGSGTAVTVSNKTYDKAGRLSSDKRNGTTALKSTFSYNIRSWLTGLSGTLFTETMKYQNGTTPCWGGDISQVSWKDDRSAQVKTYSLGYNTLGWLTGASFSDADNASADYAEQVTGYDRNGNITGLQRYGRTGTSSYGLIDNLAYTYNGNRLESIKDTGASAYSSDFRYSNGTNNTYTYTYDAAGRMSKDTSKGIASITWNVLHQPQVVTFTDGSTISNTYAADGTKLRETRVATGLTTTTDYTGNLILENGTRSRLLLDGGYISMPGNAYHWFLTDHLGSVRVVASASGAAEEYDHYYPLGGHIAQYSFATSQQPLKFQGKELSTAKSMNLYDFGARRYDPASGRWLSQDPLAEKYYAHSPYLFCAANPMKFMDPTGTDIYLFDSNGNYVSKIEQEGQHRLAVTSSDKDGNQKIDYYDFADPSNDAAAIDSGEISQLAFVSESTILEYLESQGVFDPNIGPMDFINASNSLSTDAVHNYDYSVSVLSGMYKGTIHKSEIRSNYLFIPDGDKMAHNLMNFGNYLWAASGYTLGIPKIVLQAGAHANSLGLFSRHSRNYNGYAPQLDSRDDQKSIIAGVNHAKRNKYRNKRK